MCWACEEDALWRRYQMQVAVEDDIIPPGFEPEDFEAAGLPVPSKRAEPASAGSTPVDPLPLIPAQAGIQSDNLRVLNSSTGSPLSRGRAENGPGSISEAPANPFVCDSPDKA